jgi:hypothetical protein
MDFYIALYCVGSLLSAGIYSGQAFILSKEDPWYIELGFMLGFGLLSWFGVGGGLGILLAKLGKP